MSFRIADVLLFKILLKGFGEVYAGLVGETHEYPQHIGHFVGEVFLLVAFFERLLAIFAHYDAGQFSHFFHQYAEVGEFAEVADAYGAYPFVYLLLRLLYCYVHRICYLDKMYLLDAFTTVYGAYVPEFNF
jgi:hypothetical protein